jgi:filamentous hemagglutinin family protein
VQANPVGEQVVAGAAGFERVGGALTITQGTDRAVINWNSFSIGAGEITKFVQPNSSSAVLNRVITANNPSAIYGALQANGQVYLINPAGIFIGPGGLVDTAGFVASTHDVGDKEFMGGGDLNFTGSSGASIINQGRIEAKQGDVFLVARQVSNEGQIMASDGTVGMISGTEVCLHSIGPNNYKVRLIDVANDAAVQKTGNGIADVVNAGVIEAANAELESTGNYLSLAIKNTGVIRATGVMANADGTVTLTGGEGDILNTGVVAAIQKNIQGETVGGKILASAKNITTDPGSIMTAAGTEKGGEILLAAKDTVYASGKVEAGSTAGKGGKVQVTGERVALIQAGVDVSGKTGGGTVLVGGDYLGKNPDVPNAKAVVMTSDSVIRANATENGDGGKVILWSDEYTGFYGEIFARGGIEGGNGGFVETSSKDNLQAFGTVIASAVNGQGGLWLLDPSNITISGATANGSFNGASPNVFTPNANSATANVATINDSLNLGTSVTINTEGAGTQNGDITLASAISKTGGTAATLTLNASTEGASGGNIILNNTITSTTGALNVVLNASQGSITLGNNAITTLGGSVTMRGGLGITQGAGTINTGGGDLTYYNSLNLSGAAIIQTGGGDILFNAAVNGAQTLAITAGAGNIRFVGDVGSTTTRLGAITINTAANVEFVKTVRASSLLQSAGTGTTTFSGAQNYNAGAGLNVVTDTIVLNSSVTTSSSGTVTLNANDNNVAAESGTLTIGSAGDITADGVVSLTGAIGISTAGDVATSGKVINYNSATTLTGNISVATTDNSQAGGANMIFNFTLDGGFTPTLSAGTAGNILFRDVIGGINSLDSLVMTAAGASLFGVTTLNNQTYTTPLTLLDTTAASFVSTSGNINLSNGLDSLSTTQALTISAANGTVTFGSSLGSLSPFASVSVTAGTSITTQSITTQGGGITLSGPVILSASSAYDTTASGVVLTGGNITLSSTLNGTTANAQNLSLTAGTSGSISITGITGGTRALGALTIGAATDVTFGDAVTASSVNQSAASSRKTQFAAITTTPTSAGAGGNVTLLSNLSGGQAINVSGAITTTGNSTGTISQSSGAVSIIATGPTGTVSLADINTSGGSGSITGNGANAGSLTVDTQNQSITLNGLISLKGGAATISGTGGSGAAFNLGDPISLGGSTTINTTGGGPAGGGTVGTDQNITFGSVDGAQTLTMTAGTGSITFNAAVGNTVDLGAVTVTSAAIVAANNTFNAASFTQDDGTVSTTFTGLLTLAGAFDFTGQALNLDFVGDNVVGTTMDVTNAGLFATAGGANLTVGNQFTQDGAGLNSLGGNIDSTNDGVAFATGVTLSNGITMTTGAGAGDDIVFSSTLNGAQTLGLTAGAGNITFGAAVGSTTALGAVTVTSGATVSAADNFTAVSFTQDDGTVSTTFTGLLTLAGAFDFTGQALNLNFVGDNVVGTTMDVTNADQFATAGGANLTVGNQFTQDGAGLNSLGGNIDSTNDGIAFATAVTLSSGITMTTGEGAGDDIVFGAGITGTLFDLGLTAGPGGAITGTSVNINDLTLTSAASAAFTGAMTVNDLITTTSNYTVSLIGTVNTFAQNVDFLNTGAVTLGDATLDAFLFNGGLTFGGSAPVNLAAAISSPGVLINFGTGGVTLTASSTVDTTNSGGTAAGEAIMFGSTLNGTTGTESLGLTAGAGTITFTGAVGATVGGELGAITITSAGTTLASSTIEAVSLVQEEGTLTTLTDNVTTTGVDGVNLTVTNIELDGLTIDSTAGNGVVRMNGATQLDGDVVVTRGAGAVTFVSTLDSQSTEANDLTINGGAGGDITFTGAVGAALGGELGAILISTAGTTLASSTIEAVSLVQAAGTLTTLTDNVTTTGVAGVNLTATNIELDGLTIDSTAGNGVVRMNGATQLNGDVVVTRGTGAVTFTSTLDSQSAEANDLTINGGAGGDITFTGAVGNTIDLGAVTVVSGATVLASSTFTAASFTQNAGSVATTFTGLLDLSGAFSFTGTGLTIGGTGANLVGGSMTVANAGGVFTTADGANLTTGGAFSQTGSGNNLLGGNITAVTGGVSFATQITLQGTDAVVLTSSGGVGSNIVLGTGATTDVLGASQALTLASGLGNITVNGDVGAIGGVLGAVRVTSAANATFNQTVRAASFTQVAGTGTTLFSGLFNLSGPFAFTGSALTINGIGNNIVGTTMSVANAGTFTTADGANLRTSGAFSQTGAGVNALGALEISGTTQMNSIGNISAINIGNSFSGLVTIGSSQNTALYLNRLDDAKLGSVVANQNFTLVSDDALTLNGVLGSGSLSSEQISGFSVGRLILNTGSLSIPADFNYSNIQNLSLITSSGVIDGNGVITVPNLTLQSSGQTSLSGGNKINNIESIVTGAGLELVNSQNLSLNGIVQSAGNNVITVAGQLVNNSGSSTPFAGTTGSTTLRMLSPFVGGSLSLNPAGFSGFTPGYNGVNPGARNSIIYSVSPLTMFAPSGTVIAGVDLSGTQTGGGQLNTFFTGSDDLNWIISDFAKFNLPKVSSAGLEYTIYPKRVESETRTLPDSTLSQLRQELGRPPTIEEINRREVSMRQSDRLRSGSILERSSLDSAEESNEPQENAKTTTPSPIEGQIPQANQEPKKATSPDNRSPEPLPPVAASQVLPDGYFQPNADERAAVSELLVKERANAEVGLAIPVARSK